jgi:hypothetical protein
MQQRVFIMSYLRNYFATHVVPIALVRHVKPVGRDVILGSMNVRSLSPVTLDVLLAEFRGRSLDMTLQCETWHDTNSSSQSVGSTTKITVLWSALDHAHVVHNTNRGGVAIVTASGLRTAEVDLHFTPSKFQYVAPRVTSGF